MGSSSKQIWKDYKDTFFQFNGNYKTEEYSIDFFNERNILSDYKYLKLLNSMPSILVGIGILGTFVGLTFGIGNFKTESVEDIKLSIELLLSGMGTAFVSSIYGMFLSLIYTILEKIQMNHLSNVLIQFCNSLDKNNKITKNDERLIELSQMEYLFSEYFEIEDSNQEKQKPAKILYNIMKEIQIQFNTYQLYLKDLKIGFDSGFELILNNIKNGIIPELQNLREEFLNLENFYKDYFIFYDENNHEVKPANIIRDIYEESVKQSKALQSFSTDLSIKIEAGFDTIMNNQIQKGVIPELQLIKTEIENLGKKLQDPTTEMTQSIINNLELSLGKMIDEFKNTVSGSTKDELSNLANILGQAGNSLLDFPTKLENMTNILNENFERTSNNIREISNETILKSEDKSRQIIQMFQEISKIFKNNIIELQNGQESVLTKQNQFNDRTGSLLTNYENIISTFSKHSSEMIKTYDKYNQINSSYEKIISEINSISNNFNYATKTFTDSQKIFTQNVSDFLINNSQTIFEIRESLNKSKDILREYSEKFKIIENGLQGIFEQIKNGLFDYRNTVGETLETFLEKYTNALTSTTDALSGTLSKQEEILEELNEQFDKHFGME